MIWYISHEARIKGLEAVFGSELKDCLHTQGTKKIFNVALAPDLDSSIDYTFYVHNLLGNVIDDGYFMWIFKILLRIYTEYKIQDVVTANDLKSTSIAVFNWILAFILFFILYIWI